MSVDTGTFDLRAARDAEIDITERVLLGLSAMGYELAGDEKRNVRECVSHGVEKAMKVPHFTVGSKVRVQLSDLHSVRYGEVVNVLADRRYVVAFGDWSTTVRDDQMGPDKRPGQADAPAVPGGWEVADREYRALQGDQYTHRYMDGKWVPIQSHKVGKNAKDLENDDPIAAPFYIARRQEPHWESTGMYRASHNGVVCVEFVGRPHIEKKWVCGEKEEWRAMDIAQRS